MTHLLVLILVTATNICSTVQPPEQPIIIKAEQVKIYVEQL